MGARARGPRTPSCPRRSRRAPLALPDGRPLDPLLLTLFGELRAPLPEFLAWLREPAPEGAEAGVTRYLYELYRARPDLRAAFPDVGAELVAWARMAGAQRARAARASCSTRSPERAGAGSLE